MKIRSIIPALMLMAVSGCGDFLEESSQDHDYVRSWYDLNELLIGDCYMPVHASGTFNSFSNAGMFLHLLADELEEYPEATNSMSSSFDQHEPQYGYIGWQQRVGVDENYTKYFTENTAWTQLYKYINVANNILESANSLPAGIDSEKAGVSYVKGQAHFLRAFYYFWLTNVYGQPYAPATAAAELGVPLKTTKEVEDIVYSRNTVQECYDLILNDLLTAEQEMTAAAGIDRKSIYRADLTSVQLLLSRVYLYMQNWDKAVEYAGKVIASHPDLQDLNSVNTSFATVDNAETIFSMGGDDLPRFLDAAVQCLRISGNLYKAYSVNDARREQWFWKYATFQGITKQPKNNSSAAAVTDYNYYNSCYSSSWNATLYAISSLFWLRSGEAYLNLAEAEACRGNFGEARNAINKLRRHRFYKAAQQDAEITSEGSRLISDIRNERKLELVCEGHRWFDLRRYRVCEVQPEKCSLVHTYTCYRERGSKDVIEIRQFVLGEDDPSWTMPIPQEVIDFNVGMPNNGNQHRDYTIINK